jgi:hypothetical protein
MTDYDDLARDLATAFGPDPDTLPIGWRRWWKRMTGRPEGDQVAFEDVWVTRVLGPGESATVEVADRVTGESDS